MSFSNDIAGPVLEGYGLRIDIYAADGETKPGEAMVDDAGASSSC